MSFFKKELTDLELFQKELEKNGRRDIDGNIILFEDEFIEVRVGNKNANKSSEPKQLPSERNNNVSDRRRVSN